MAKQYEENGELVTVYERGFPVGEKSDEMVRPLLIKYDILAGAT